MLSPGTLLGPYRIVETLGAGGMGEVYKARDTRLDRTVALKTLPSTDPERRLRFVREAKAVAALSHPHICVLHDIGTLAPSTDPAHPLDFIVIEYLEGESLAERLERGPLPTDAVLELAVQIADALDAAHGANVIHRDVKPQNIFVTTRGQAKVLDFGIAKLGSPDDEAGVEATGAATKMPVRGLTSPGTAIGTTAYMSPEQARGEEVDARTDIFSFGAVLYEMATGRPAFSGRTSAVIVDELLNKTPAPPSTLDANVPIDLTRVISRSLEKDRTRRYQRASDLGADLRDIQRRLMTGRSPVDPVRRRKRVFATIGVAMLLVAVAATVGRRWLTAGAPTGAIDSIAVLPFVNTSGTPDADYLSDGLADSLTNSLTRVPGLRVVPGTLAIRFKNTGADPREVGEALNARALVTGRVSQRGERLTVQAELIDAATVAQIWGDQFDRPIADILQVKADISKAIVDNLRLHLTSEDQQRLVADAPQNALAYQLYLRGRHESHKRTPEGYAMATRLFEQAIAQDSGYARAHAGLADVYHWQGYWGYLPATAAYPKAMDAAQRALALDERSADAHASLGWLWLFYRWNWEESERHYRRALALAPDNAVNHAWYGESLSTQARHDEAIAEVRRAAELDPTSHQMKTSLAFVLSNARRYPEALDVQKLAAAMGQDSTLPQLDLARMYRLSGQFDEAIALSRKMVDSGDPLGPTFLAASYGSAGRRAEALALARTIEREPGNLNRGYLLAIVYSCMGERDEAFRWLEVAYRERDTFLPWLKVEPEFDPLRKDPRLDDLIRRVGIPSPSS